MQIKWKSQFLPLIFIMLFITPFTTGCVIKTPFQNQSDEKKVLSEQVKADKSERRALQSELEKLKAHLKTFKADLQILKIKATEQSKKLKKGFPNAQETRAFTEKMRDRVKKTFKNTVSPLKKGYEETLEKSNQEMAAFQKQLKEKQKKVSQLKAELTNKVEKLLSLKKEIESAE